jgi:hypothetical protein
MNKRSNVFTNTANIFSGDVRFLALNSDNRTMMSDLNANPERAAYD